MPYLKCFFSLPHLLLLWKKTSSKVLISVQTRWWITDAIKGMWHRTLECSWLHHTGHLFQVILFCPALPALRDELSSWKALTFLVPSYSFQFNSVLTFSFEHFTFYPKFHVTEYTTQYLHPPVSKSQSFTQYCMPTQGHFLTLTHAVTQVGSLSPDHSIP